MEFIPGMQDWFNISKSVHVMCQKFIDLYTTKSEFNCTKIFRNHPGRQENPRWNAHCDK